MSIAHTDNVLTDSLCDYRQLMCSQTDCVLTAELSRLHVGEKFQKAALSLGNHLKEDNGLSPEEGKGAEAGQEEVQQRLLSQRPPEMQGPVDGQREGRGREGSFTWIR
jgi:hypothetical protein